MNAEATIVVALLVACFWWVSHHERQRADRIEEERDIFVDLLVADAHEKAEWE